MGLAGRNFRGPHEAVRLRRRGAGLGRITFRLATTGDAMEQFRRLTQDVLPFVAG